MPQRAAKARQAQSQFQSQVPALLEAMPVRFTLSVLAIFLFQTGPLGAQLTTQNLDVDGIERTYLEYLPAGFDAAISLPLVLSFHGGGGNAQDQLDIADLRNRADEEGFVLVYPSAIPDPNDGGGTNWQVVVSGTLPFTEPNPHSDIDFIEALIDEMADTRNIDTGRVYAMGYSNGGGFAFDLACRLNHKITGIGVVARTMYAESFSSCNVVHPTPVVTILGTSDFISAYDGIIYEGTLYYHSNDEVNNYWIGAGGLEETPVITDVPNVSSNDGSTAELYTWTSSDGCHELLHYKVNGGGHDWPGSFGNQDFVSHDVIWETLSQHDMEGRIGCGTSSTSAQGAPEHVHLYPNPASDQLHLAGFGTLGTEVDEAVEVRDMQGRLLPEVALHGGTLDVSDWPTGLYVLHLAGHGPLRFAVEH